jgi:uncharacterized protein
MNVAKPRRLEPDVAHILAAVPAGAPVSDDPVLVLTAGLPGSGKSTFSRRLAFETGAVVLESDALRCLLFARPYHSRAESHRLFSAVHAAARVLLSNGVSVIIDATSLKESDRRPVYALAATMSVRLLLLHFSAPEAVISQRLMRRLVGSDPEDNSTAGMDVYLSMTQRAEPLMREHWRIDTSDGRSTTSAFTKVVEACRSVPAGSPRMRGVS